MEYSAMKMTPRLTQQQTQQQRIVMTPKLQQAIKVLLLPQYELSQFVEQEMQQNPFLEIDEEQETALSKEDYDPSPKLNTPMIDLDKRDTEVDIDWHSVFDDLRSPVVTGNDHSYDPDAPEPDIAESKSLQDFLHEQLLYSPFTDTQREIGEMIIGNLNDDGQLVLKLFSLPIDFSVDFEKGYVSTELYTALSKKLQNSKDKTKKSEKKDDGTRFDIRDRDLSSIGVDCRQDVYSWILTDTKEQKTYTVLKENDGLALYELTLEDIADKLRCSLSDVTDVLQTIQTTFEPVGIAFRDIKESLCLQIEHHRLHPFTSNGQHRPENDEPLDLSKRIVEDHLDDLLNNRIMKISRSLDVEKDEVVEASRWISTLSPYPGRYFSDPAVRDLAKNSGSGQVIIPDVEIKEIDGEYRVFSLDNYVPRLRINPYYVNLMRNKKQTLDPEAKKWIEEKYIDASDLLSSITQRGRTIERVTEAIFEIQSDFLTNGANAIKPLTLKTVADMAGVHESTVSRVTSSKNVQTPQGTYPLKFFFSNQLTTTHGESVSARQAKAVIRDLINREDSSKPLSDQAISNSLKGQGIKVARRTVQKYREELGILASRQRKQV